MQRSAAVAGSTGLVGRAILHKLLADDTVTAVHAVGRRPFPHTHPKLTSHVVDFATSFELPGLTEVYLAIGTTIAVAGSQAAFRRVDYEANLAAARAARAAGARRAGLVSAMGADARSRVFYSRVKGELEEALDALGFDALVIARPSLLAGNRELPGQSARTGEKVGLVVSRFLGPLVPANYRPIAAQDVAAVLVRRVPVAEGREVLLSGAMQPR